MATQSTNKKGNKRKSSGGGGESSLKVVYISSPMKVRTSATRFRSLVQELTGKNSDIARYMDVDGGGGAADFLDEDGMLLRERDDAVFSSSTSVSSETTTTMTTTDPATSDSFLDDNINASGLGFLSSSTEYSLCVDAFHSQMDVLGSYHDLLL